MGFQEVRTQCICINIYFYLHCTIAILSYEYPGIARILRKSHVHDTKNENLAENATKSKNDECCTTDYNNIDYTNVKDSIELIVPHSKKTRIRISTRKFFPLQDVVSSDVMDTLMDDTSNENGTYATLFKTKTHVNFHSHCARIT